MKINKLLIILSLYIIPLIGIKAQEVEISKYSFLNTAADTLVFYGQSESEFDAFVSKFSQMIQLGNRQVNILHLGDSHLQADIISAKTRKDFQSFLPGLDGSVGMITPFTKSAPASYSIKFSPSWHSMNILSTSDKDNLGLWGTTAYTTTKNNTIEIDVNGRNKTNYDFNCLRIYHSNLSEDDNIIITDIETAYQKVYHKNEGYTEFIFADYISSLNINISKSDNSTFYLYGLYFNNGNPGVVYNVSGTIGATAQSFLNANKLQEQLNSIPTDLIIISLGTNDAYESGGENTFENNLTNMIHKIRETKNNVPIVLISPQECYWHRKKVNPRSEKATEIVENVAKNNSCIYLDMYSVMGGKNSASKLYKNNLMQTDRVHLSQKGYQLQGDLLYNALWRSIEKKL